MVDGIDDDDGTLFMTIMLLIFLFFLPLHSTQIKYTMRNIQPASQPVSKQICLKKQKKKKKNKKKTLMRQQQL